MGTVPRIGLRRTQAVDDLLNGIWELRPELKRKNTTTILLGLEAFLRECRVHAQRGYSLSDGEDATPAVKDATMRPAHMVELETGKGISDDIEW